MYYPIKNELKWLINQRPIACEVDDYKEDGIIFLIENGEIVGMGKEKDDAHRK